MIYEDKYLLNLILNILVGYMLSVKWFNLNVVFVFLKFLFLLKKILYFLVFKLSVLSYWVGDKINNLGFVEFIYY